MMSNNPGAAAPLVSAVADALAYPLMVLQADALLLYANRAALAALEDGVPLALVAEGRVGAASEAQRAPFLQALRLAAQGERQALVWADEPVPLHAWVCPLPAAEGAAPDAAAPVMLVQAPPSGRLLDVSGFAQHHALSPAETRVLEQLLAGRSTRHAAQALGVGLATVRTHVLSIRRKTGHQGVPALLSALGALPPLWPAETR
jgi:DNA-binding CsgD family transcriptional regulator